MLSSLFAWAARKGPLQDGFCLARSNSIACPDAGYEAQAVFAPLFVGSPCIVEIASQACCHSAVLQALPGASALQSTHSHETSLRQPQGSSKADRSIISPPANHNFDFTCNPRTQTPVSPETLQFDANQKKEPGLSQEALQSQACS